MARGRAGAWRWVARLLGASVALLLGLALALGALVWWVLSHEDGLQAAAARVPGLLVVGTQGKLNGGPFKAQKLTWQQGDLRLVVDDVAWTDLRWHVRPHPNVWLALTVEGLTAQRVELQTGPSRAIPQPPASLRLPASLHLPKARLQTLQINDLPAVRDVETSLRLGAEAGSTHHIESLAFTLQKLRATATGTVKADAPMAVSLRTTAQSVDGAMPPWQAQAQVEGTLERLHVNAVANTTGRVDTNEPASTTSAASAASITATTTIEPFTGWPVKALKATLRDVDLASLLNNAPNTNISGQVHVTAPSKESALLLRATLQNAMAGRWDERLLPARTVDIEASGSLAQPDRIDLARFNIKLHNGGGDIQGTGQWLREQLTLAFDVQALRPAQWDSSFAALKLTGPTTLRVVGLPSPQVVGSGAFTVPNRAWDAALKTKLSGQWETRRALASEIELDATAKGELGALSIRVAQLAARSAGATAKLSGTAQRTAAGAWSAQSQGTLTNFDPLPWYAGTPGTPWREGKHLLNGEWLVDLQRLPQRQPVGTPSLSGYDLSTSTRGAVTIKLGNSRLAGVPLQGQLAWQHEQGRSATVKIDLQAGANTAQGQGTLADQGTDDRWQVDVNAPDLASLGPLVRLHPTMAAWQPRAGSMQAQLLVEGRWPTIGTVGTASARRTQWGSWSVGQAEANWRISRNPQAPLSAVLDIGDVRQLGANNQARASIDLPLESLSLNLQGTWASHQIRVQAATPLQPPAWSDTLLNNGGTSSIPRTGQGDATAGSAPPSVSSSAAVASNPSGRGSMIHLKADGAWVGSPAGAAFGGGTWQLNVADATALSRQSTPAQAWFSAQNTRLLFKLDAALRLLDAQAAAGSGRVLGAGLTWKTARWHRDAGSNATAALDLDATLEPIRVAPLLQRILPGYGWGGDLTVGGQFIVRTTPQRFDVDWVIERQTGDITITDEGLTQSLGLSDLRLALKATDGTWHFTQAAAGTNLGVLVGAQTVRVPPATRWPSAQTPLEGVMSWRVENLTTLAPWLPPGWRASGTVAASATLGGRFGAPEYVGQVTGTKLAVRNILEGVDVRDGDLKMQLRGTDAKIERLVLKGGDGELSVVGGATFGASPALNLRLLANKFQALGRVDRRIMASGQADLSIKSDEWQLDGKLAVDEGLIDLSRRDAPKLDSDVTVARRSGAVDPPAPSAAASTSTTRATTDEANPLRGPARKSRIRLQLDLGDKLQLKGRGIDTKLAGSLLMTSPNNRLSVQGNVRAESGTYNAYGQNLLLERGVISFTGPADDPRLDIVALRPNLDIRVGVAIVGTALNPRVRLFSEPEMNDTDKLSWLMLGRAPEGLGRADTALLQRAALALWAGEDGESPSDALLKTIGLDELSVRQTDSGDVRDTVIRVGKQIGRRWYIGYERGVNTSTGTWQVIYRIAQRLTVRAQSGSDNSLDAIWTWRWN